MLVRGLSSVALAVLLLLPWCAESKQPQPPAGSKNKPADQQNGTRDNPFIVKVIPEEKPQYDIDAYYAEQKRKAISDDNLIELTGKLALYTGLLFIATAILAFATAALVIAGFRQSGDTRRGTEIARRNLELIPDIERAYVSGGGARQVTQRISRNAAVGVEDNEHPIEQSDGTFIIVGPTNRFEVHINNHGKTPARVHHFRVGFFNAAAPPPDPPYGDRKPLKDTFGPGTQSRRVRVVDIPQGQFARTAICGRFYWDDIWGRHWSSGFAYEIPGPVLPNDSLSIETPAAYTEDREEPNGDG